MSAAPLQTSAPGALAAWWLAIRPRTLGASLAPVLVGSAAAIDAGRCSWAVTALCACAAVALQIATNLANDALDFLHGIDNAQRIGPPRATQAGWLTARTVLLGCAAALTVATLCGVGLSAIGGWRIVAIGLASIAAALLYSAGPFPLASHGLGELAAFVFFGIVAVCGTTYLQLGRVTPLAWLASLAIGSLVANLMVVNNLRDMVSDAASGKRTLAVRIGARATRHLFAVLLVLAFAIPPVLVGLPDGGFERLLPWAAMPWAWRLVWNVQRAESAAEYQSALLHSARLHAGFGALLALGLAA